MDWIQVIVAIIGVVTLEGVIRFFFVKETKKSKQIENVDADVEKSKHANELLAQQLDRSHATIEQQNTMLEAKDKIIAAQSATIAALFDDMCIHKGCRLRKPHQGQGPRWYEQYKDDPALGADYSSVDTLIKQERLARLKLEKEATEGTLDAGDKTSEEIDG